MSAPFKKYEDPLNGIACELCSAMSALNMEPRPKENPDPDGHGYLSEVDEWAEHSMEHMHAAFDLIEKVRVRLNWFESLERWAEVLLEKAMTGQSLPLHDFQYLEKILEKVRALRPDPLQTTGGDDEAGKCEA